MTAAGRAGRLVQAGPCRSVEARSAAQWSVRLLGRLCLRPGSRLVAPCAIALNQWCRVWPVGAPLAACAIAQTQRCASAEPRDRATIAFPESDRPVSRELAMPLPRRESSGLARSSRSPRRHTDGREQTSRDGLLGHGTGQRGPALHMQLPSSGGLAGPPLPANRRALGSLAFGRLRARAGTARSLARPG